MIPTVLNTHTFKIGETEFQLRELARAEVLALKPHLEKLQEENPSGEDIETAEVKVLAYGLDHPEDEVKAWYQKAPSRIVNPLVEEIFRLSGITEDAEARFLED